MKWEEGPFIGCIVGIIAALARVLARGKWYFSLMWSHYDTHSEVFHVELLQQRRRKKDREAKTVRAQMEARN
jgi:hypothetical protein